MHLTGPNKGPNDLRRHNSSQQLATVQDNSPQRIQKNHNKSSPEHQPQPLASKFRRSSSLSSSESSAIESISSPFDDASLLDGRFSPIQGSVLRKQPHGEGGGGGGRSEGGDGKKGGHPLIATTADFDFRPTNCIIAQQYETPVSTS